MDMDREQSVQHFLDLIKKSHRVNYWRMGWMYKSAILKLTGVPERRL